MAVGIGAMATVRRTSKTNAKIKRTPARVAKKPARKSDGSRTTDSAAIRRPGPKANSNGKHPTAPKIQVSANQKQTLEQERTQVEHELANLRAEMQQAPEMTGDEVDLNVYEREKTFGLIAAYERRLEEIGTTLRAAAEGRYGICERCGAAIDPERLEIFPETRLCVNCKNLVEREQRRLRM